MELETAKFLQAEEYEQYEQEADVTPDDTEVHPWVYVHERCGGATQMPDNVRYNYLADPYHYFGFLGSVCSHCGGGVPDSQLFWTDTGESLADYMRRLKQSKSRAYHAVRYLLPLGVGMAISSVGLIGNLMDGKPLNLVGFFGATLFFAACAWLPCRYVRLFLCQLKVL